MKRATARPATLVLALLSLALLHACTRTRSRVGGESLFLSRCESSEACGDALACIDQLCTVRCTQDARCAELAAGARCLSGDTGAATDRCDLPCEASAECSDLGSGFLCLAGRCRPPGSDAGAPERDAGSDAGAGEIDAGDASADEIDAATGQVDASLDEIDASVPMEPPDAGARPACTEPRPDPLPELPPINFDESGRPLFDTWRDLECRDDLAYLCFGERIPDDVYCNFCVKGNEYETSVCTDSTESDRTCDGELQAIGYGDGLCVLCDRMEIRARVCCEGLEGFDCRAWPYPGDGAQGMLCARHEDCEPDLVCAAPKHGSGYGVCSCPGTPFSSPMFFCGRLVGHP